MDGQAEKLFQASQAAKSGTFYLTMKNGAALVHCSLPPAALHNALLSRTLLIVAQDSSFVQFVSVRVCQCFPHYVRLTVSLCVCHCVSHSVSLCVSLSASHCHCVYLTVSLCVPLCAAHCVALCVYLTVSRCVYLTVSRCVYLTMCGSVCVCASLCLTVGVPVDGQCLVRARLGNIKISTTVGNLLLTLCS